MGWKYFLWEVDTSSERKILPLDGDTSTGREILPLRGRYFLLDGDTSFGRKILLLGGRYFLLEKDTSTLIVTFVMRKSDAEKTGFLLEYWTTCNQKRYDSKPLTILWQKLKYVKIIYHRKQSNKNRSKSGYDEPLYTIMASNTE